MRSSPLVDAEAPVKPRRSWPLWTKIVIGAAILAVVGLAVGLGVGLTRGRGGEDGEDDNSDSSNNDGNSGNYTTTWKPAVNTTWQIILYRPMALQDPADINPDVDVYDLDLYDNDAETFKALQDAGKKVICYFSAGSWENWRDDKDDFKPQDLGKALDGWPDEKWLNVSSPAVRDIMRKRIAAAAEKGCDAIDPDNVDGFQNDNGLNLTRQDTINFVKFLSAEAASHNMSTGLKNAGDVISDVLADVAFSVNEQCVEYSECETFKAFVDAGKPVFHIEYPGGAPDDIEPAKAREICSGRGKAAGTEGFSTVIKKMKLDGWVRYCDGKTYNTKVEG
ncbi:hypothetical protein HJFPF1_07715 [Paramyrothecium foliicola]|nr:hypothetical protein HJFPF1_07715 [Paramyrothecium foliicola]